MSDDLLTSDEQFDTTTYGLSDRYRGIDGARNVVLVNGRDIGARSPQR